MKIQKMIDAIPATEKEWHSNRCDTAIPQPVEINGVYVFNGEEPELICVNCIKPTDLYIWGNPEVIRNG